MIQEEREKLASMARFSRYHEHGLGMYWSSLSADLVPLPRTPTLSMEKWALVNMDVRMLEMCASADPKTCLETSKNQILGGLCGRSRHRLYTSDSSARAPRAAWTKRAEEPRSEHLPWSKEGTAAKTADAVPTGDEVAVVEEEYAAAAAEAMVDMVAEGRRARDRLVADFTRVGAFWLGGGQAWFYAKERGAVGMVWKVARFYRRRRGQGE